MAITISEKRKTIMFRNRERAMEAYKDKWTLAYDHEDRINCRRIYETLRDTETQKIGDSYDKEQYILAVFKRNKDKKCRRAFRIGTDEVLIIEKTYKGAGGWYDFIMVDGTTDDNNVFLTDDDHRIAKIEDVYQNNFYEALHKILFYINK